MGALVIGLGQYAAGDDGIGLAVVEAVRRERHETIRTEVVSDPSELVRLLATRDPVIIVDAVVESGSRAGKVSVYDGSALSSLPQSSMSTHGIGVGQAIELARALDPDAVSARIIVVGIHIDRPTAYSFERSADVEAALLPATQQVLSLCEASHA